MKRRERKPDLAVSAGERLLAWGNELDGSAASGGAPGVTGVAGVVGGTREALYLKSTRIPWEQVKSADWDAEATTLTVTEVGSWGAVRPVHKVSLDEPVRLLQLIRERVTATVLLSRHVAVEGRKGVRVIARRAPSADREITWVYEFDEGIDPENEAVRRAAQGAMALAQEEAGL